MNHILSLLFLSLFSFFPHTIYSFESESESSDRIRSGSHDEDRSIDQHASLLSDIINNSSEEVEDYIRSHTIDRHLASLILAQSSRFLSGAEGVAILDFLIEAGANVNIIQDTGDFTPLMNAEDEDVAQALINCGATINSVTIHNSTALTVYTRNLDEQKAFPLVKLLLENQADASIKDMHQKTALHYAVDRDLYRVVELLS